LEESCASLTNSKNWAVLAKAWMMPTQYAKYAGCSRSRAPCRFLWQFYWSQS